MMPITFNSLSKNSWLKALGVLAGAAMALVVMTTAGYGAPVDLATARRAAEGQLRQHMALFGNWNGAPASVLDKAQMVHCDENTVAVNFRVLPSGHILIALDDRFSPVLLYSTRADFDPRRARTWGTVEAWMVSELDHQVQVWQANERGRAGAVVPESKGRAVSRSRLRIQTAWKSYRSSPADVGAVTRQVVQRAGPIPGADALERSATTTVGPLLASAWGQEAPYNGLIPNAGCSDGHALTGCVATAWAQLLLYWRWPDQGSGAYAYQWSGQTLSVDFDTATPYDWDHMPPVLATENSQAEQTAVSQLIYHMALVADTDFGCDVSSSAVYADEVLGNFFKYQNNMQDHDRSSGNYSNSQWFALFQNELDADPPRPVVLSIWGNQGGHEVIADGYQSDATDLIHINFGWDGYSDGYYNITNGFETGGISWEANTQIIITGIEPDNLPPEITPGPDQQVREGDLVQFSASAVDPETMGTLSYGWTQTSGPAVSLTDPALPAASFTAPQVDSATELVFQLRVEDVNRAWATASLIVSVVDADAGLPEPDSPSKSSGGCFIRILGN